MISETYRGRKLKARKVRESGTILVTCNGEPMSRTAGTDLRKALDDVKGYIDLVDRDPSVDGNRWGAYMYAPGTYEMCPEGIHPQDIGGKCRHVTCANRHPPSGLPDAQAAHETVRAALKMN